MSLGVEVEERDPFVPLLLALLLKCAKKADPSLGVERGLSTPEESLGRGVCRGDGCDEGIEMGGTGLTCFGGELPIRTWMPFRVVSLMSRTSSEAVEKRN